MAIHTTFSLRWGFRYHSRWYQPLHVARSRLHPAQYYFGGFSSPRAQPLWRLHTAHARGAARSTQKHQVRGWMGRSRPLPHRHRLTRPRRSPNAHHHSRWPPPLPPRPSLAPHHHCGRRPSVRLDNLPAAARDIERCVCKAVSAAFPAARPSSAPSEALGSSCSSHAELQPMKLNPAIPAIAAVRSQP